MNRLNPETNGHVAVLETAVRPEASADMPPVVESALLRILAVMGKRLTAGDRWEVQVDEGGLVLTLSADYRQAEKPEPRGQCEQDVYDAVRELVEREKRRAVTKEIATHLEATDRLWGRSTIVLALAALVDKGLLVNPHDKRGYGLPEAKGGAS